MIWNVQNIFTSEYKCRLFGILHTTQEFSVVQRIDINKNDGNANIIDFIDASYVKTENTTILERLQKMLGLIYKMASKDKNIYQANLWIPKQSFPD